MRTAIVLLILGMVSGAQEFNRGVGVYPGDPTEDWAPTLRPDTETYRNVALRRPAFHSSAYDYNLTAQLVTDGIKDTRLPRWVSSSSSATGVLPKHQREWFFDDNSATTVDVKGPDAWVQVELAGGDAPFEVDRIDVEARSGASWTAIVSGSDDGKNWTELGRADGVNRRGEQYNPSFTPVKLNAVSRARFYRVTFSGSSSQQWRVGGLEFFLQDKAVRPGGPQNFTSAWKPAGSGEEWVYVDLGSRSTFDRVVLNWIYPAGQGAVQMSDDAKSWTTVQELPTRRVRRDVALSPGQAPNPVIDDIKLASPAQGRYVRVVMTNPARPDGYILSELEVYGRGGLIAQPHHAPAPSNDGSLHLAGGRWRVQRESQISADPAELSRPGFDDSDWVVATVPATTLSSYWNAGALPDPNFGDNQLMISDSFFQSDFWYRTEFVAPKVVAGQHVWLNFDGVNWKADVFLNGSQIGRIDGGFLRGRFEVTSGLKAGVQNALAVRVYKNANPGSVKQKTFKNPDKNGGVLGADSPTYHASIGWDWIPTIRGRDTGIWNDVRLTTTGQVTIEDPFVTTVLPLPDTSRADVNIEVTLRNNDNQRVTGILRGRYGDLPFEMPVTLEPRTSMRAKLNAPIRLSNPKLWWPVGYGEPSLYKVEMRFETAGGVSDSTSFQSGVRQWAYTEEGGALRMWINGRRFVPRGGNWGFPESMLRYRGREYDIAVRYHRDMNLTMIRNWVGQIGDDEFYEACDRHGVVVWQDFWLANPWDGPDPDDNEMFLRNSRDLVAGIRNHASVGLYCGRNEGYPPEPLEKGLRAILAELHPGLHYIPSSADEVVSGHGPYQAMPGEWYYKNRATPKFHSELGMPNIVTYDSLKQMMPESAMWPMDDMWGLHDFSLEGAQGGSSFIERVKKSYGGANSAEEWVKLAQFVNYEGYRGMFEAQSKNRMGLLIWMSHPAWPSFVWQTYDYYFDPTAAYFAVKKASEPLHIQWNPTNDDVEVVNYSGGNSTGLTATAEILNTDGFVAWQKTATLDSKEDSAVSPMKLQFPARLSDVHFIRLKLSRGGQVVSENLYWRGNEPGNYTALRNLSGAHVESSGQAHRQGDRWMMTYTIRNRSRLAAPMIQLKVAQATSDPERAERMLPAIFSDNFFTLMPGETKTVTAEVQHADTLGKIPSIVVEPFSIR